MQKIFNWTIQKKFSSESNLLCPSPLVIKDTCYIFFGEQTLIDRKAIIKCIKLSPNLNPSQFEVRFEDAKEHSCSNGNLPNSLYILAGKGVFLVCAEFNDSTNHKHRLNAHLHTIQFCESYCLIGKRTDLDFIDYEEDFYHTVAGMSYFEGDYFYAMGDAWDVNGLQTTPITKIYRYNVEQHHQTELKLPIEKGDLAIARPIMLRWNGHILLAFSVRSIGQYSSKIFYFTDDLIENVNQNFHIDSVQIQEKSLAYEYPFVWLDRLWCLCTLDFRGTKGFYLFRLEED